MMMPLFGIGRKSSDTNARLFFATDIHGSERCFRKWLNAATVYRVDALILGGDLTGKAIVPLVEQSDGWYGEVQGQPVHVRSQVELAVIKNRIRDLGFYDVIVTPAEAARLEDPSYLRDVFNRAMADSLSRWVNLAEERLSGRGVVATTMLGNDDDPDLAEILRTSSVMTYSEDGVVRLPGGHEMISTGFSNPTPWNLPRELPEDELEEELERKIQQLEVPSQALFNLHCPPFETHLDQAPKLDDQLRPVVNAGGAAVESVGSTAVRQAIERTQPLLGLHGHIHESPASEKIGRTLCINPGSDYGLGVLRGALVELSRERVVSWQLLQG